MAVTPALHVSGSGPREGTLLLQVTVGEPGAAVPDPLPRAEGKPKVFGGKPVLFTLARPRELGQLLKRMFFPLKWERRRAG